jgi:heptosyltransferase III
LEIRRSAKPKLATDQKARMEGLPRDYLVLHPGSGALFREWPPNKWSALACKLEQAGWTVVFTGHGKREQDNIGLIRIECPNSVNLCSQLSWQQFVRVLQKAKLVVGVESTACHVAAAVSTPCVAIYTGATNTAQMRPFGDAVRTVTFAVPCSPCFRSTGCDGMECVRNVTVDRVFEACAELVEFRRGKSQTN